MTSAVTFRTWILRLLAASAFFGLLLWLQVFIPSVTSPYVSRIIMLAGFNIILAVSLNLINGITGQFSLGHAGFMAVGAYTGAAFTYYAGPRLALAGGPIFALALILAAVAAGICGLIVGLPSLRLRGDYLAIVTLGFGQIIIAIIQTVDVLGGALGLNNLPRYTTFVWVYGAVALCLLCSRNLADSALGRSMRAVRDDEIAAQACGINTTQIKVAAFVISSMWAGVAGALAVHLDQLVSPSSFDFVRSVEIVVMVVLGGLGSITGATAAAVLLTGLEEVLRSTTGTFWVTAILIVFAAAQTLPRNRAQMEAGLGGWWTWLKWPAACALALLALYHWQLGWLEAHVVQLRLVIYAIILIVLMLLRPQGLLGRAELSFNWLKRREGTIADGRARS